MYDAMNFSWEGRRKDRSSLVSHSLPTSAAPRVELVEIERWRLADGVMFSVVSSLVLWGVLLTSLYQAFV